MSSAINQPGRDTTDGHTTDRDNSDRDNSDRGTIVRDDSGGDATDAGTVLERQKERFGGMKAGSAFFGWLTATGTTVILLALVAAIATAVGANSSLTQQDATDNATKLGIAGGIVVFVVILVAYFCGGYVAGRMARFNGVRQGVGVFLWAVIITVVIAILGAIAGNQFDVLSRVGTLPQMPTSGSNMTAGGIISLLAVAVAALIGAILGGLAGMRFHRRIDRADLTTHP